MYWIELKMINLHLKKIKNKSNKSLHPARPKWRAKRISPAGSARFATPKYRVEAEVRFDDYKCKFLLWDCECNELLGKPPSEL
jgi:hypothetical protein